MTGGCSTSCTKDVESGNIFSGRTRERVASIKISRKSLGAHANRGLIKGCSSATDGIQTSPTPAPSTVTLIRKARLQIRPSAPDANLSHGQLESNVNKDLQYSVTSPEPKFSRRNLPAVHKKSRDIPSIRLGYSSPKKEKLIDPLLDRKILAKSIPVKSSVNTYTAKNSSRIGSENHHDKSGEAQHRTTTRSSNSFALQRKMNQVENNSRIIGSTRNQTAKVPSQVGDKKFKSTPIASQTKLSSRRVKSAKNEENQGKKWKDNVVIAQDLVRQKDFGSEFLVQDIARSDFSEDSVDTGEDALGIICPLCEKDLSHLPPGYEDHDDLQPSNLPEVSVLHCGHAFHSSCLEDIVPPHEQCRDPPCYFCLD